MGCYRSTEPRLAKPRMALLVVNPQSDGSPLTAGNWWDHHRSLQNGQLHFPKPTYPTSTNQKKIVSPRISRNFPETSQVIRNSSWIQMDHLSHWAIGRSIGSIMIHPNGAKWGPDYAWLCPHLSVRALAAASPRQISAKLHASSLYWWGFYYGKIGNSGDLTSFHGDRNETWDCLVGCLCGIIHDYYYGSTLRSSSDQTWLGISELNDELNGKFIELNHGLGDFPATFDSQRGTHYIW